MHEGHRQRMLKRLVYPEGLQDHEVLEILLYNAIPRKNTNPVAHELLAAFPSLSDLLHAEYEELLAVSGVGPETAAYLRCIGILTERIAQKEEVPPVLFSPAAFMEFLQARLGKLRNEVVEVFSVNGQGRVRSCKRFSLSAPDRAEVETGKIGQFFAAKKPAGIVLAHNHPTAPARPSAEDDAFTAQMQLYCSMNGIRLYDHIIIGQDGAYSYFLVGRMDEIRRKFNITALVEEKLRHE